MSDNQTYDVAVIGAGVFGSWTAYCLQKSGAKVALLDAYGPANGRASSGGESRIIRMGYGADAIYTRWSFHALPLWQQLFAQAGQPHLFQRTGVLWISQSEDPYALASLASMRTVGAKFEEIKPDDLRRRYPQIAFEDAEWGIFEPDSGVLLARRAVQVVAEQAQKIGVDYLCEEIITPAGNGRLASAKTLRAARSPRTLLYLLADPGSLRFSPACSATASFPRARKSSSSAWPRATLNSPPPPCPPGSI